MADTHLVFVYGTLRKGYGNNALLTGCDCLGVFETTEKSFKMFTGSFPIVTPTGAGAIRGELYEISDRVFRNLDMLEGYPRFYDRKKVRVKDEENTTEAWMYIHHEEPATWRLETRLNDIYEWQGPKHSFNR